ncbi:hypothetical protein MRB53_030752 [Persea americana]|uniref:Uncharacterized protein n=1 Tax=Persea americana TaxID=3435 RepID=A0ACC2KM63_PERAE|nr:hypothetical protein MRB53_030752 [Persea americana]
MEDLNDSRFELLTWIQGLKPNWRSKFGMQVKVYSNNLVNTMYNAGAMVSGSHPPCACDLSFLEFFGWLCKLFCSSSFAI